MKTSTSQNSPASQAETAPTHLSSFSSPLRRRTAHPVSGDSRTKQEFRDECDINRILSKFQRTGAMQHFAKYAPAYGDFNACDYQTAQNILLRARKMFDALPSNVRTLVSTPQGFLEFVQNPANADKMAELGLKPTPPAPQRPPDATPAV